MSQQELDKYLPQINKELKEFNDKTLIPLGQVYCKRDGVESVDLWNYSENKPTEKGWIKVSFWYRSGK